MQLHFNLIFFIYNKQYFQLIQKTFKTYKCTLDINPLKGSFTELIQSMKIHVEKTDKLKAKNKSFIFTGPLTMNLFCSLLFWIH